jgi:hypothetical protein
MNSEYVCEDHESDEDDQEPYEDFLVAEKEDDHEEEPDLKHELLTLGSMDFRSEEEGQEIIHAELNQ